MQTVRRDTWVFKTAFQKGRAYEKPPNVHVLRALSVILPKLGEGWIYPPVPTGILDED